MINTEFNVDFRKGPANDAKLGASMVRKNRANKKSNLKRSRKRKNATVSFAPEDSRQPSNEDEEMEEEEESEPDLDMSDLSDPRLQFDVPGKVESVAPVQLMNPSDSMDDSSGSSINVTDLSDMPVLPGQPVHLLGRPAS